MRLARLFVVSLAIGLLACSGCRTSSLRPYVPAEGQTTSSGRKVAYNVDGMINGVFLFYYIPLWSGHPWRPNKQEYKTYEHLVKPKYIHYMFNEFSRAHKLGKVEDVQIEERSSGVFTLWIVWNRQVIGHASIAVPDGDDSDKPKSTNGVETKDAK